MFFSKYATSAVALLAATFVAAQTAPQVQTPASLVECQPAQITWTGGSAPYFLTIIPGGMPGSAPLVDLGSPASSPVTWPAVNVTSGTSVTVALRDGSGQVYYSAAVSVQAGTSSSCIGNAAAAAPAGSSSSGSMSMSSSSAAGVVSSAVSSASMVASSAVASASSAVSSVAGGASSKASSVAGGASSVAASGTKAAASGASSAAASSGAAGKLEATGLFAVLLAAVGAIAI